MSKEIDFFHILLRNIEMLIYMTVPPVDSGLLQQKYRYGGSLIQIWNILNSPKIFMIFSV